MTRLQRYLPAIERLVDYATYALVMFVVCHFLAAVLATVAL